MLGEGAKPSENRERPTIKITSSSIRFLTADSAVEDGSSELNLPGEMAPARGSFSAMWVKQGGKWKLASLREARAEVEPAEVNVPEELAGLDWLVGDWNSASGDHAFEVSANWNSNHTFLLRDFQLLTKGKIIVSPNQRIGWDSATQQIKSWTFESNGGHAEAIWTRHGDSWVARSSGVHSDGNQMTSLNTYTPSGKNTMIWRTNFEPLADGVSMLKFTVTRKGTSAETAANLPPAQTPISAPSADEAKKAEILASNSWRRAIFEMNEWLSSQTIYDKAQAAQIKADFANRVAEMSASELEATLQDLDAKFKLLESPQAKETRAWAANYLSILSDKRRDEIVKQLPNFATMTAKQLSQELIKVEQKKSLHERRIAAPKQTPTPITNPWDSGANAAMPVYSPKASQYSSPYRPAANRKPFDTVQPNKQNFRMHVGPYGGIGLTW